MSTLPASPASATAFTLVKGGPLPAGALEAGAPLELARIAYEKHHAAVFHAWLELAAPARREALRDRHVFLSVSHGVGAHLAQLGRIDRAQAQAFMHELVDTLHWLADGRMAYTEEWFHGLEQLTGALGECNDLAQAREVAALGLRTGVERFPRVAQTLAVHAAWLDAMAGRREQAAATALRLVRTPYLLPSRRDLPRLYQKLMFVLAGSNLLAEYRRVLWQGVTSLHARGALRDAFVDQIVKTYRGAWRAVIGGEATLPHRLLFLIGNLARLAGKVPPLRALGLPSLLRGLHTAVLWGIDRLWLLRQPISPVQRPSPGERLRRGVSRLRSWMAPHSAATRAPKRVLVTRAMGGLGDLLMMTPGLQALARGPRPVQVDFAIPKNFHPLLDGLQGVRLLDINAGELDVNGYDRWVNLTDCPAGRREAQQFPNVRDNRIEVFARAMGVRKARLRRRVGMLPFYRVRDDEAAWARQALAAMNPRGLPVIGVQPYAADTYRNWPHMQALVQRLAQDALVLVFHHEEPAGFDGPNIVKVVRPLRQSIALLAQCERLVVLDSSFLHFSAALGLPAVAVFGAISGRVRTRDYPKVHLIAPDKQQFPCYPCWRHEHKPCHLTQGRESICLRSIEVDQVVAAVRTLPQGAPARPGLAARLGSWLLYGRD